ncbi:acyl-CoA thioesterase [Paraburkholderia youngii]
MGCLPVAEVKKPEKCRDALLYFNRNVDLDHYNARRFFALDRQFDLAWPNRADAFASCANSLKRFGW